MKRKIILTIGLLAVGVAGWWMIRSDRAPSVELSKTQSAANSQPSDGGAKALPASAGNSSTQAASGATQAMLPTSVDAKRTEVAAVLEELKKQYGYAGALGWDDAKALIAKREKATKALEDRLAALGAGGAAAISSAYSLTSEMRDKLLLIHALGRINDNQAASALQGLLASETSYSLQREMVVALSRRTDNASTDALAAMMNQTLSTQSDSQLRFAVAQALGGRASALSTMSERIPLESSVDVQKELVRSVGAIGSEAAMRALAGFAQSSMDVSIREAAIQQMSRKFGEKALALLDRFLSDPNELIRQNTVMAVAQIKGGASTALLERVASSDASSVVRESAQTALASIGVR